MDHGVYRSEPSDNDAPDDRSLPPTTDSYLTGGYDLGGEQELSPPGYAGGHELRQPWLATRAGRLGAGAAAAVLIGSLIGVGGAKAYDQWIADKPSAAVSIAQTADGNISVHTGEGSTQDAARSAATGQFGDGETIVGTWTAEAGEDPNCISAVEFAEEVFIGRGNTPAQAVTSALHRPARAVTGDIAWGGNETPPAQTDADDNVSTAYVTCVPGTDIPMGISSADAGHVKEPTDQATVFNGIAIHKTDSSAPLGVGGAVVKPGADSSAQAEMARLEAAAEALEDGGGNPDPNAPGNSYYAITSERPLAVVVRDEKVTSANGDDANEATANALTLAGLNDSVGNDDGFTFQYGRSDHRTLGQRVGELF